MSPASSDELSGRRRRGEPLAGLCALALAASLGAQPARAQALNSGQGLQSSEQVATPTPVPSSEPPLPAPEALFSDIGGLKKYLSDHGVAVLIDATDEFSGNISGGGGPAPSGTQTSGGSSLDGQVGLETDIDWEKLAGITGFSTHTIIVGRYGGKPASTLIGDTLNPSQEIYGAGGNVVTHLVQAFGEETLARGKVDITFGRIPLDDDFASSPLYCNFENNTLCGNPKNFTDNFSHSSYPDANWAVRARVRPVPDYYLQTGIFFSENGIYSNKYDRSGWKFDSSDISGEAFPVEAGWEPSFGPAHLPGHYKAGFVYDNNHHTDEYFDIAGSPYEATGLPARMPTGSTSAYVLVDQMVSRNNPGPTAGVLLLAGYLHNDPETSIRTDQFYVGVEDGSFWQYRPYDGINALFSYQRVSGLVGKSQAIAQEEGLPPSETVAGASGVQTWAMIFELNYAIHVTRGFYFAPDFQYYVRPNAQTNLPDAAFLGFKSHIELF